jgi:non-specific serine/threonine protein kinase
MALKGTTKDTRALAREQGATHLVTGSVRKAGTALRVTAELVAASTDRPIWSEKFTGVLDDVFGIQEEISRQIVDALEVRLTETEEREVAARPIDDPVAYDCYLRARQLTYNWTEEAQYRALHLVDEAIDIIGESALLLATKGQIRWNMVNSSVSSADEGLPAALDLVAQALAIDPNHSLAIFVRGLVAGTRGESGAALKDLHRAHSARPGDANVITELVRWSFSSGLQSAGRHLHQQVRIDPLNSLTYLSLAWEEARFRRRPEEIAKHARRAMDLSLAPPLHKMAGWFLADAGLREEAAEVFRQASAAAPPGDPHCPHMLFLASALEGDEEEALRSLPPEAEEKAQSEWDFLPLATGYALLGHREAGVARLRSATKAGFLDYPFMSERCALLEGLRGDAGFAELMDEVKPRWEALLEWEAGLST